MAAVPEQSFTARAFGGPAVDGEALTPSDTANSVAVTRAVYFGTGGTAKVTMASGNDVTFANIPDGTLLAISITRLYATGSATIANVVGLR